MIRKYQSVEKADVLSPADHQKIETGLHRLGKTNAQDLTEDERQRVLNISEHTGSDS